MLADMRNATDQAPTDQASTDQGAGDQGAAGPLQGIRVVEVATVLAGPLTGQILADFGAEVIKVEHPDGGDSFRTHGPHKDEVCLWWTSLARNKRCVSLYLGDPEAAEVFKTLVDGADVLIENFRPGTMDRWGIGYDTLSERNPRLVMASISGFGQSGPYRDRPGFGTLAEAMSGFASITGEAGQPPTLPALGLADSMCGMTAVGAVMMALYNRDRPGGSQRGQQIDLSLLEPMLCAVGPGPIVYDQLGVVQERLGNRSRSNAPRNTYQTRDGKWLAISTSTTSIAARVMELVGHPEVVAEPWFASAQGRGDHLDLLDSMVAAWIVRYEAEEAIAMLLAAEAAVAQIYDASDVIADPQVNAMEMITTVDDPQLGPVKMQNVLFRMSKTPGSIRHTGRALGADTDAVLLDELGIDAQTLDTLRTRGVAR